MPHRDFHNLTVFAKYVFGLDCIWICDLKPGKGHGALRISHDRPKIMRNAVFRHFRKFLQFSWACASHRRPGPGKTGPPQRHRRTGGPAANCRVRQNARLTPRAPVPVTGRGLSPARRGSAAGGCAGPVARPSCDDQPERQSLHAAVPVPVAPGRRAAGPAAVTVPVLRSSLGRRAGAPGPVGRARAGLRGGGGGGAARLSLRPRRRLPR